MGRMGAQQPLGQHARSREERVETADWTVWGEGTHSDLVRHAHARAEVALSGEKVPTAAFTDQGMHCISLRRPRDPLHILAQMAAHHFSSWSNHQKLPRWSSRISENA